jgi:hypothetical protein
MNVESVSNHPIVVLLPLYDDWESLRMLLGHLDDELSRLGIPAQVLVVDDASNQPLPEDPAWGPFEAIETVQVLRLRRNLGHQRAIAIGLAHVEEHTECPCVVVMDSDGEDAPADVPRLLERFHAEGQSQIVFAERTRRSESYVFTTFYHLYRVVHLVLTGVPVRVGNYSVVPRSRLESLVVVSEMWNHYAAAVIKSRQPHCLVPTRRATRLSGRSRMNFVGLVIHGLSALSVFSETIGARLLIVNSAIFLLAMVGVIATLVFRLGLGVGVPGWATNVVGTLVLIMFQSWILTILFCFGILGGRQATSFIPRRDYTYFAGAARTIYSQAATGARERLTGRAVVVETNGDAPRW